MAEEMNLAKKGTSTVNQVSVNCNLKWVFPVGQVILNFRDKKI